ncbi:SDR family oxidoreductase [Winogradskyella echinorum]|uniref:SDR family oxidoreductase n=1 Tax=Winogradskyella echinorum TaxID=538189 RepID=A0ABR6Y0T2_9FLAO|nr:SDR family oxidoreductase [Winogradskyella echinorum]MBC3846361.1 SDR family oxidoreductase [Winogradskyella echinorum]MBC5750709.1 SDR family oxidoreductase [Winogradskyella echinorum]
MNNNRSQTVLLAGATGYLGSYIAKALVEDKFNTKLIARSIKKLQTLENKKVKIIEAEVTKPDTLIGICEGVTTVISTVGITRQKEGLTYMDVDYKANLNLLNEAKKAGVKKFIYVSAINGHKYRHLKIFEAKEKFVDALKNSGLDYCVIRPNGFFSDMKDFLDMARKGKIYLFGNGEQKFNPIHGEDLAIICLQAIKSTRNEIIVGGPDVFTLNEIGEMALEALEKPIKIIHLPDWIRRFIIWCFRTFTSSKTYGPIEFFLTLMAEDNIAPRFGTKRLYYFFREHLK